MKSAPPFGQRSPRFRAPDGSVELVLREIKQDEDDSVNGPEHGKHYLLRDLKSGKEIEFAKLPGFEGAVEQLQLKGKEDRFLFEPPLRLAFFGVHLNSTDGDTDYALDLTNRRFVRLSPNWAAPIPLPGEPAFLTMTYVRYVPIPGTNEDRELQLSGTLGREPEQGALCAGRSRRGLLRSLHVSAGKNAGHHHGPQERRLTGGRFHSTRTTKWKGQFT